MHRLLLPARLEKKQDQVLFGVNLSRNNPTNRLYLSNVPRGQFKSQTIQLLQLPKSQKSIFLSYNLLRVCFYMVNLQLNVKTINLRTNSFPIIALSNSISIYRLQLRAIYLLMLPFPPVRTAPAIFFSFSTFICKTQQ